MASLVTATLGAKGQITLPKDVRELLGGLEPGSLVGFLIDPQAKTVKLTRLRVTPDEDFTEEEYQKLLGLSKKGAKSFSTMRDLVADLKKRS